MTGRHRQTRTTGAQRALLGTVPVLGVAGVVGALATVATHGPDPGAAGEPLGTPRADDVAPAAAQTRIPGPGDEAAGAAGDAAGAAANVASRRDAQERRHLEGVAAQVRDDAQQRQAEATRDGRTELDQFQAEQQRRQDQPDPQALDHQQSVPDEATDAPRCEPGQIVGRDCGLFGLVGKPGDRSDPWIDGQLLDPLSPGPQ